MLMMITKIMIIIMIMIIITIIVIIITIIMIIIIDNIIYIYIHIYIWYPPQVYRFKVHLLGLGVPYINTDAICKYTLKKRLEIDTRTPLRYLNREVQT